MKEILRLRRTLAWLLCFVLVVLPNAYSQTPPRPKLKPVPTSKAPVGAAGYLVLLPIDDVQRLGNSRK